MPENQNDKTKPNQDKKPQPGQPMKQNEQPTRDPSKSGQPNKELEDQVTQKDTRRP